MVVFGQNGSIWAKVGVFGKSGCNWAKVVVFGQSGCNWAKCCFPTKWLFSGTMVVFEKNGCIRAYCLCL